MPGPTTEVLNDDLKEVRAEAHRIDLDVRQVSTQVGGITSAIRILGVLTITGVISSVWWGASLTAKVDGLDARLSRMESKADERFAKIEEKLDRIEAALSRPEPRPATPGAR